MRDFAGRNESFRGRPPSNRQFQSIEHCNPHGGTFKMYKKEDNPSILGYSLNTGVKYHLITCTWTWTWNMVSNSEQLERNHPTASRVATQFDSGVHRLCLSHTSNHTNKPVISKINQWELKKPKYICAHSTTPSTSSPLQTLTMAPNSLNFSSHNAPH